VPDRVPTAELTTRRRRVVFSVDRSGEGIRGQEDAHSDVEAEGEPGTSEKGRTAARDARAEAAAGLGDERAPLFSAEDAGRFRQRWESLQGGFVDQPQEMVEQADDLVSELMQELTAGFNEERSTLEVQWGRGDEASTEELRAAMTRCRSFFNRLLSV
jgi:hypothetical protein